MVEELTLKILFTSQITVTAVLVGLIWTIQLVQYPSFRFIEKRDFIKFHNFYTSRISLLVIPLMLSEAFLMAFFNLLSLSNNYPDSLARLVILNLTLAVIWGSTFFVQVPLHRTLEKGFDQAACTSLIRSNWIRTIAWSLQLAFLLN